MKKNSVRHVTLGVLVGIALLVIAARLLTLTLGNTPQYLYAGKPMQYWQEQLSSHDMGASNEAFVVVNSRVMPQLTDTMFHDTNDSSPRLFLIEALNTLPGVQIYFNPAAVRRASAAQSIGALGPAAKPAVPALVQALKGKDASVHQAAISALGNIHSDPDLVIPLLIGYLEDDNLNDEAALALANYGSLAKAAVPKIIPLLHAPDKDAQAAAREALKRIDPEAYMKATKADQGTVTNRPSVRGQGEGPVQSK
jgi:HEAT repeats